MTDEWSLRNRARHRGRPASLTGFRLPECEERQADRPSRTRPPVEARELQPMDLNPSPYGSTAPRESMDAREHGAS